MNLEKLFGSKAKVDILKYLLFRRQGISMRALEADLNWTFPAIKKQIDGLEAARIIIIEKDNLKRSIKLEEGFAPYLKQVFLYGLKLYISELFSEYKDQITTYYLGKVFGYEIEPDLVILHNDMSKEQIAELKVKINNIFRDFYIDQVAITCMSQKERDHRYRLADKFVLQVMKAKEKKV